MPSPTNTVAGFPGSGSTLPVQYANFRQYVANTMFAAQVGTVASVANALASSQTATEILVDPVQIAAYASSIGRQINDNSYGPRITDLADRIANITIDTTAQGASTLEVTIIDPMWVIPQSGMIQADVYGYLLPLDVKFPSDTDMVWRLVQYRPSFTADLSRPNLVLTFEDRIVSLLRQCSPSNTKIAQGQPNQTLSEFVQMLVTNCNKTFPDVPATYMSLIAPADVNAKPELTALPTHAARKIMGGLSKAQQAKLNAWQRHMQSINEAKGEHMFREMEREAMLALEGRIDVVAPPPSAITLPVP